MDNESYHIGDDDMEWKKEVRYSALKERIRKKISKIPGFNSLHLGYFSSIQSLKQTKISMKVDNLFSNVIEFYKDIPRIDIYNIFLTLKLDIIGIIKNDGGNNYRIYHIKKASMEKEGILDYNVLFDEDTKELI